MKDLSEEKSDIEILIGDKDGSVDASLNDLDGEDTITSRADENAVVEGGKKR